MSRALAHCPLRTSLFSGPMKSILGIGRGAPQKSLLRSIPVRAKWGKFKEVLNFEKKVSNGGFNHKPKKITLDLVVEQFCGVFNFMCLEKV